MMPHYLAKGNYRATALRDSRARVAANGAVACAETVAETLSGLLLAEHLAMTLYYTALTTPAVASHPYLAGTSGDVNNVASNGNAVNVANFQAALDQEYQHARTLVRLGASSRVSRFFFPKSTFAGLGYTRDANTFLWVLDHVETALVGAYLAAVQQFSLSQQPDLAVVAARILGTEAQHRALGRLVSGDTPANNMALEVVSFYCPDDVTSVLQPYLEKSAFTDGSTGPMPLPAPESVNKVVGKYHSK
jgi:hypothetical protein